MANMVTSCESTGGSKLRLSLYIIESELIAADLGFEGLYGLIMMNWEKHTQKQYTQPLPPRHHFPLTEALVL